MVLTFRLKKVAHIRCTLTVYLHYSPAKGAHEKLLVTEAEILFTRFRGNFRTLHVSVVGLVCSCGCLSDMQQPALIVYMVLFVFLMENKLLL